MVQLQNHYECGSYVSNMKFYSIFHHQLPIGSVISVKGLTLKKCDRFQINLLFGQSVKADVALHVNPRFPERLIVRNTREDGLWNDNEEKESENKFNLKRDCFFNIRILCTDSEFMIFTQDEHFCNFRYRFSPTRPIDAIEVQGDVENINVECNQIDSIDFRSPVSLKHGVVFDNYKDGPMLFTLTKNFMEGHILHINGRVKLLPTRFSINLQHSACQWPHPQIAYHFNPRYCLSGNLDDDIIIQNTLLDYIWGQEDRIAMCRALRPGQVFSLSIRCFKEGFGIWLNSAYWTKFTHRVHPAIIDTLRIQGDVRILSILEEYR